MTIPRLAKFDFLFNDGKGIDGDQIQPSRTGGTTVPTENSDLNDWLHYLQNLISVLKEATQTEQLMLYGKGVGSHTGLRHGLVYTFNDFINSNEVSQKTLDANFELPNGRQVADLAYNPVDGKVYGIVSSDIATEHRPTDNIQMLFTIDLRTGAVSRVGSAVNFGVAALNDSEIAGSFRPLGLGIDAEGVGFLAGMGENSAKDTVYTTVMSLNLETGAVVSAVSYAYRNIGGTTTNAYRNIAFGADETVYVSTWLGLYAFNSSTRNYEIISRKGGVSLTKEVFVGEAAPNLLAIEWVDHWNYLVAWFSDGRLRRWNGSQFTVISDGSSPLTTIGNNFSYTLLALPVDNQTNRIKEQVAELEREIDGVRNQSLSENIIVYGGQGQIDQQRKAKLLHATDFTKNNNLSEVADIPGTFTLQNAGQKITGLATTPISDDASLFETATTYGIWADENHRTLNDASAGYLFTLNTDTGVVTRVGSATNFGAAALNDSAISRWYEAWGLAIHPVTRTAYISGLWENSTRTAIYTGILEINLTTGALVRKVSQSTATGTSFYRDLAFQGSTLYATNASALYTIDLSNGTRAKVSGNEVTDRRTEFVASISYSPYWNTLVAWCWDGRFRRWNASAKRFEQLNDERGDPKFADRADNLFGQYRAYHFIFEHQTNITRNLTERVTELEEIKPRQWKIADIPRMLSIPNAEEDRWNTISTLKYTAKSATERIILELDTAISAASGECWIRITKDNNVDANGRNAGRNDGSHELGIWIFPVATTSSYLRFVCVGKLIDTPGDTTEHTYRVQYQFTANSASKTIARGTFSIETYQEIV